MDAAFLRAMLPQEVVVYLMIFFGALLAFEGVRQLVGRHGGEIRHKNRRMRMIARGMDNARMTDALLRNHAVRTPRSKGVADSFQRSIAHANLPVSMRVILICMILLAVALFVVLSLVMPVSAAALMGLALGFGLPYAIFDRMADARLTKLTEQLPDALDMMARGLRVGHPLNVTLRRVARDMPDPIGSEFGIIEDRIRHGVDMVTVFQEFAERIDREDVHYLSVCIGIQNGTGGNLGRVLLVLSRVIRDRLIMQKKIHALSSEGRLSGMILTLMPFLMVGAIYQSSPGFFLDVKDHPVFIPVAVLVLTLIILQGFILKRLTSFDF